MNYEALINDSLTLMYGGVRRASAADHPLKGQGEETTFRVRETPERKNHAADLEGEKARNVFEVIHWSDRPGATSVRLMKWSWSTP
jgi:hypothetical protein